MKKNLHPQFQHLFSTEELKVLLKSIDLCESYEDMQVCIDKYQYVVNLLFQLEIISYEESIEWGNKA